MKGKLAVMLLAMLLFSNLVIGISIDDAKEAYRNARDEMLDLKDAWHDAREVYRGDPTPANWETNVAAYKEYAKKVLDVAVAKLEIGRARVEADPNISDDLRTEVYAAFDDLEADIEAIKPSIDDMSTLGDFLNVVKDVVDAWKEFVAQSKKYFGLILADKSERIVEKGDEIADDIEARLDEMEAAGEDTGSLRDLQTEYLENVDQARALVEEAEGKFNSITVETRNAGLYMEGLNLLNQARLQARSGIATLRQMRQEFIRLGWFGGGEE
jgi:hypothetical protein